MDMLISRKFNMRQQLEYFLIRAAAKKYENLKQPAIVSSLCVLNANLNKQFKYYSHQSTNPALGITNNSSHAHIYCQLHSVQWRLMMEKTNIKKNWKYIPVAVHTCFCSTENCESLNVGVVTMEQVNVDSGKKTPQNHRSHTPIHTTTRYSTCSKNHPRFVDEFKCMEHSPAASIFQTRKK